MPPAPKLTDDQAAEIYRRRTADPSVSWRAMGDELGVSHTVVKDAFERGRRLVEGDDQPPVPVAAPHNRLAPSPLNPRKRFDPEAHERMVESARDKGVLIPLMVRRANVPGNTPVAGDADYEIIGGERRWRGAGALIVAGERPDDWPMPIKLIDPCDDATYLELALTENGVRKDMTPYEEAVAFAQLRALGRSAAEIGKAYGMVKRTVEMRLRLVRDLDPCAQDALRDGIITVEAANILAAYCPRSDQGRMLDRIEDGHFRTTADLKRDLTSAMIPQSAAMFPVADYTGLTIADPDDPDRVYFTDASLFERLQQKAIAEAELKARGRGYAWTKVLDNRKSEWFHSSGYITDAKAAERGVVYEIKSSGRVDVHTDVVSVANRTKDAAKAAGLLGTVEAAPYTKAHLAHARRRKTVALQSAIGKSPDIAMRAMCLALIGCGENIRIRTEHQGADDKVDSPEIVATIERYLPRFSHVCKEGLKVSAGDVRRQNWHPADGGAAWDVLAAMPDGEVAELFAALTALRVGSFATYDVDAGDRPIVVGMARSLGLIGTEAEHGLALQRDDLEGLRKPALLAVKSHVCPDDDVADLNLAGLKDHLLVAPPDYVLPTLRFGDKATVEAMFKAPEAPEAPDARQINIEDAIAEANERRHGSHTIMAAIRSALAEYSPFSDLIEGKSSFAEIILEEDFPAAAAALAQSFAAPSITADVLYTVEDFDHLVQLIARHTDKGGEE